MVCKRYINKVLWYAIDVLVKLVMLKGKVQFFKINFLFLLSFRNSNVFNAEVIINYEKLKAMQIQINNIIRT